MAASIGLSRAKRFTIASALAALAWSIHNIPGHSTFARFWGKPLQQLLRAACRQHSSGAGGWIAGDLRQPSVLRVDHSATRRGASA